MSFPRPGLPPKSFLRAHGSSERVFGAKRGSFKNKGDYLPVTWTKYFDRKQDVPVNGNTFRVYIKGDSGPYLVLLHGGGFSALTWSLLASTLYEMVDCRILAIDLRGHGATITTNDQDLSIETLATDVVDVINEIVDESVPVILVGHSLGGSIAVHAGHNEKLQSLVGIVVIDVVEGTALGALSSMQSILRGRPQSFNTIEEAIRWSVQSGQLKNLESAKVSMPGQIKNTQTGKVSTHELEEGFSESNDCPIPEKSLIGVEIISEEEEAEFRIPDATKGKYSWRIDLRATESHWPGWFKGLSKLFLSCPAQKLLLLASLDRLDTDLTVAQMQGKFEVHAFEQSRGRCGHSVHEDIPDAVAEVLATFVVRNKFTTSKINLVETMPCC